MIIGKSIKWFEKYPEIWCPSPSNPTKLLHHYWNGVEWRQSVWQTFVIPKETANVLPSDRSMLTWQIALILPLTIPAAVVLTIVAAAFLGY